MLLCEGHDGDMVSGAPSVSDGPRPLTEERACIVAPVAPQELTWKCHLLPILSLWESTELQLYKYANYLLKYLLDHRALVESRDPSSLGTCQTLDVPGKQASVFWIVALSVLLLMHWNLPVLNVESRSRHK